MKLSPTRGRRVLAVALLTMIVACADRAPVADPGVSPTAASAPRGVLDFEVTPRFDAGPDTAFALVAADFDGDGKLDLATTFYGGGGSVLLGRGGGAFAPPIVFEAGIATPAGGARSAAATADFNGDGKPDLAVAGETGVVVLLGKGDGTFQSPGFFAVGPPSLSMVAGDFDGDGKPDLAVGSNDAVHVLYGRGDGTFDPPRCYSIGHAADMMVLADLDGDGKPDLLVANHGTGSLFDGGTITVLLGNGKGGFQPPRLVESTGGALNAMAVGDLDGDGKPDLVFSNAWAVNLFETDGAVSVALGNGDGSFRFGGRSGGWSQGLDMRVFPSTLVLGDFDGDGKLDVAGTTTTDVAFVLPGNGDGTFRRSDALSGMTSPRGLVAADLDGDGKLDLAGTSDDGVSVLLGRGDGTFRGERAFGPLSPHGLTIGDFNRDGKPDCLVTDDASIGIVFMGWVRRFVTQLGDGHGCLRGVAPTPRVYGLPDETAVAVDVDGDGILDVVAPGDATVLLGKGDGTFLPAKPTGGPRSSAVAVADFNGDRAPDLVFLPTSATAGLDLRLGKGDGTFQPGPPVDAGGHPLAVAAADLDGDGKPDLVVSTDQGLRLLYGKGDGTFEPPESLAAPEKPAALAVADLDDDGRPDLVMALADGSGSMVLLNRGGRRFQPTATVAESGKILVADLDGDGVADLAIVGPSQIALFVGNGDGTFQAVQTFAGVTGVDLALADLDADGLPDLLFARGSFVRVVRNRSRR